MDINECSELFIVGKSDIFHLEFSIFNVTGDEISLSSAYYNYDGPAVIDETYPNVLKVAAKGFQYSKISSIDMSRSNIEELGQYAFNGMKNLIEIKLPPNLKKVHRYAFAGISLLELEFPSTVEYIENYATFEGSDIQKFSFKSECPNFKTVDDNLISKSDNRLLRAASSIILFNTDVAYIGVSAFSGTKVERFVAGPSLVSIDDYGFIFTTSIKHIDFSNCKIHTISGFAFWLTSISSITLPSTVNLISIRIFHECKYLKSVLYLGETDFTDIDIFPSLNIKVFVTYHYPSQKFGKIDVKRIMESELISAIMRMNYTCESSSVYPIGKLFLMVFIVL